MWSTSVATSEADSWYLHYNFKIIGHWFTKEELRIVCLIDRINILGQSSICFSFFLDNRQFDYNQFVVLLENEHQIIFFPSCNETFYYYYYYLQYFTCKILLPFYILKELYLPRFVHHQCHLSLLLQWFWFRPECMEILFWYNVCQNSDKSCAIFIPCTHEFEMAPTIKGSFGSSSHYSPSKRANIDLVEIQNRTSIFQKQPFYGAILTPEREPFLPKRYSILPTVSGRPLSPITIINYPREPAALLASWS